MADKHFSDGHQSGKPARSGAPRSSGYRSASGVRTSSGGRSVSGSRPAVGNRSMPGNRPAVGNRPASGNRPTSENRAENSRPTGPRPVYTRSAGPRPVSGNRGLAGTAEMEGLAARRLALKVLRQVLEEGAFASLSLNQALQGCGLQENDRRLATRLVYDTLDHLLYLDYALDQIMARPDTDVKLRNILRLGACQILLEDRIPESAATNTAVQLCVELGMPGLKGVCNGILRNLVRHKDELVFPSPETDPDKAASLRFSVPVWLWQKLLADWGDQAEPLLACRLPEEGHTLRPNLTRLDDAGMEALLARKVWGKQRLPVPHAWHVTGAMDIMRDADFRGGNFSLQSASSMLAVQALEIRRGLQVLDCCAAPGGKTCYAAELMAGTGRVFAWDVHPHRVELITAQARRLGLENIRAIVRDATEPKADLFGTMDRVLLDAPCTGLGMLAEKPDLRLRVSEDSVLELVDLQRRLLDAVCGYVKPGGLLVYATCSVLKDENERQVQAFLQRHPEFEPRPLPESIPEKYRHPSAAGLQLLPHVDGVEGFYFCGLTRKA